MQKVYEDQKAHYIWKFPDLGLSYCEIPKTGSSSTKTVLFRLNYNLAPDDDLQIGGGQLARRFRDSMVNSYDVSDFLDRVLVIYRDPIARVKSAYRSIFLGRQKQTGSLSQYFDEHFISYLESEPGNGLLNHHKPMSWFFPQFLINDPRTIFVETQDLNALPETLGLTMDIIPTPSSAMPHLLNVNKGRGEVDMTDAEIRSALGVAFDDDFGLYETLQAKT